jgi:hypothetical protein
MRPEIKQGDTSRPITDSESREDDNGTSKRDAEESRVCEKCDYYLDGYSGYCIRNSCNFAERDARNCAYFSDYFCKEKRLRNIKHDIDMIGENLRDVLAGVAANRYSVNELGILEYTLDRMASHSGLLMRALTPLLVAIERKSKTSTDKDGKSKQAHNDKTNN